MASTFKHRNLPHLLLRARETFMARFRPILREHGITEQQWRVLRTLNDTGDMEPNQLADACLILSPSLTRMLAAMEQSEMIVRTRSSVDQRRQVISLTSTPSEVAIALRSSIVGARRAIGARAPRIAAA